MEIPAELLSPTVEELEERTAQDLAAKRKSRKRLGKRERSERAKFSFNAPNASNNAKPVLRARQPLKDRSPKLKNL
jgi:hypothetical protein